MEAVMTVLTDKEQALVRSILLAGMSTQGTSLTRVVGVYLDCHTLMQEGFVGNRSVQFSEAPTGLPCIGTALLLTRFFAVLASCPVSNVCQVLQPNQRVGVLLHDALTHHMVGVLLQPSLSPAYPYQSPGSRASAFVHQTLPEPRIMVGFGNKRFPRMKRAFSLRGTRDSEIAYPDVNSCHLLMSLRCGIGSFYLKCDEQVELFFGLIIPKLGGTNLGTLPYQSDMLVIAGVGHDHPSFQCQDTRTMFRLETVVMSQLVGQGGRDVLWGVIQPLVPFLGQSCLTCCSILLDLCPEGFVRSTHLPGNTTSHLRREMKTGA